jgi:toxin ParE1/3/4
MNRVVLSRLAASDLREIENYISKTSTTAARRVVTEIRAAIASLSASPGIGHRHEDLDGMIRVWPVYSYLIMYLPASNPLQVLRIIHGARDLREIGFS